MKLSQKIFFTNLVLLMVGITTTSIFSLQSIKGEFLHRANVALEQRISCLHSF